MHFVYMLVPCEELEAPDKGVMTCTGDLYEDICIFQCDNGYELTGSDSRTCQSNARWSGSEAVCSPGM